MFPRHWNFIDVEFGAAWIVSSSLLVVSTHYWSLLGNRIGGEFDADALLFVLSHCSLGSPNHLVSYYFTETS